MTTPDFLRSLKRSNDEHERLLGSWEDDLRRRERETGDGEAGGTGSTGGSTAAARRQHGRQHGRQH
jgi:hypothetical protein